MIDYKGPKCIPFLRLSRFREQNKMMPDREEMPKNVDVITQKLPTKTPSQSRQNKNEP